MQKRISRAQTSNKVALGLAGLCSCNLLSGCLVMGYSSRGGAFIWPGGLGMVVLLLVLWLLFRGR